MTGPMLIYDGDCAFCRRCVDVAARMLPAPVRCEPYQVVDLAAVGLTAGQAREAAWWVGAETPRRGHRAIAAVLRSQPSPGWRAVGLLLDHPPVAWLAACVYLLVARFRHRLPGGTSQCRVEPRADR